MQPQQMTARQWLSVAVSVTVLALGIVAVSSAIGSPVGRRIDLVADAPRSTATGDEASATPLIVPDPPATSTTTMPPRAEPVRLAPTKVGPLLGAVIVVDPGHNGQNFKYADIHRAGSLDGDGPLCNTAGASTNFGIDELTINWKVGQHLTILLRGLGAEVVLTHRDIDGFGPCADERGAIARDVNATALVSIHADGSDPGSSGFHIIFPASKPSLDPGVVAESGRLARVVRDELLVIGGRPANYVGSNGVQERGDLANLNTANRPAILAELGNLRNSVDALMLSDDVAYEQIARALARAVVRFVGKDAGSPTISADVNGDGWPDFLPGAPQLVTTTTTTTTSLPPVTTMVDIVPLSVPTTVPVPLPAPPAAPPIESDTTPVG